MPNQTLVKVLRPALILLAAATCVLAAGPAMAGPVIDPIPIQSNQFFTGRVNGTGIESRIAVRCDLRPGVLMTGHPLPGQTVDAVPLPAPIGTAAMTSPVPGLPGYTGSAGRAVSVDFGVAASTTTPAILTAYYLAVPIPSSLVVPCSGTGIVVFNPAPNSPNARPSTVNVTFVKA